MTIKEKAEIFLVKYQQLQTKVFYLTDGKEFKKINPPKLDDKSLELLKKLLVE